MKTPVKTRDFKIHRNEVIHKPTGARFSAYPESKEVKSMNWGRAGEVLESGADYDRDYIYRCAKKLIENRRLGLG
jgi:hypothetical protein